MHFVINHLHGGRGTRAVWTGWDIIHQRHARGLLVRCGCHQSWFSCLSAVWRHARLPGLCTVVVVWPARQQPTFCLDGQRLNRGCWRAATPRLPACCKIRGCGARTRRQVACHAGLWALSTPMRQRTDSSGAARKWGAAKPSCSCFGVGLWRDPGAKDVWSCDWTTVSCSFRWLWSAMIPCATGEKQSTAIRNHEVAMAGQKFFTSRSFAREDQREDWTGLIEWSEF